MSDDIRSEDAIASAEALRTGLCPVRAADDEMTWTVGRLIRELQKLDPSLGVISEGCDCTGPVRSIDSVTGDARLVMLSRSE